MNMDTQSVDQTVSAMADVLAEYLNPEEVRLLTRQWQQYSTVSVKMMQQCVLDATRRYPELQVYKSDIRKGFWDTMQADNLQTADSHSKDVTEKIPTSEVVEVFYTVMETLSKQLTASERRSLFQDVHQAVSQERTFKGHVINMSQFLEGSRPPVPDDEYLLNNVVQLVYVYLCDIAGPVEADDVLFRAAETAKQSYPKAVVEKLF